jgi:hypothetical protein
MPATVMTAAGPARVDHASSSLDRRGSTDPARTGSVGGGVAEVINTGGEKVFPEEVEEC